MAPHVLFSRQESFQEPQMTQFGCTDASIPVNRSTVHSQQPQISMRLDGNRIPHYTFLVVESVYLLWSTNILVHIALYLLYLLSNAVVKNQFRKGKGTRKSDHDYSPTKSKTQKVEETPARACQRCKLKCLPDFDKESVSGNDNDKKTSESPIDSRISAQSWLSCCYTTNNSKHLESLTNPSWSISHSFASAGLFSLVVNSGFDQDDHESADSGKKSDPGDRHNENSQNSSSEASGAGNGDAGDKGDPNHSGNGGANHQGQGGGSNGNGGKDGDDGDSGKEKDQDKGDLEGEGEEKGQELEEEEKEENEKEGDDSRNKSQEHTKDHEAEEEQEEAYMEEEDKDSEEQDRMERQRIEEIQSSTNGDSENGKIFTDTRKHTKTRRGQTINFNDPNTRNGLFDGTTVKVAKDNVCYSRQDSGIADITLSPLKGDKLRWSKENGSKSHVNPLQSKQGVTLLNSISNVKLNQALILEASLCIKQHGRKKCVKECCKWLYQSLDHSISCIQNVDMICAVCNDFYECQIQHASHCQNDCCPLQSCFVIKEKVDTFCRLGGKQPLAFDPSQWMPLVISRYELLNSFQSAFGYINFPFKKPASIGGAAPAEDIESSQIVLYPFNKEHLGITEYLTEALYREDAEYFNKGYIGGGRFGKCYKILDVKKKQWHVVKKVQEKNFNRNELDTMRIMEHQCPGLMPCYGATLENKIVNIYMPYAACGSVHSFLEEVKEETGQSGLNRNQSLYILHGLLSAVKALHDKRILHCDIKTANLLISMDAPYVVLGDFGLAKMLKDDEEYLQDEAPEGTYYYLSPEVMKSKPYSFKADTWSCICVLHELQTGDPPWYNYDVGILPYIIGQRSPPQIPEDCEHPVKELYELGWKVDQTERATAAELLQTEALRQVVPISHLLSSYGTRMNDWMMS